MSTPNLSIQERGAEWRATAEAAMTIRLLTEYANEPSGKRFVRSRPTRIERWQQLAECASKQAAGLQALAKAGASKRARPARVIVHDPGDSTPEQAAAAAEARCEGDR